MFRYYSRVLEFNPRTLKIVWQYQQPYDQDPQLGPRKFFSSFISSAQRLPNGNTMITEGQTGRIFEVTRKGEIVWEYLTPHRDRQQRPANIIRMKRYPASFFAGLDGAGSVAARDAVG